MQNNCSVTDKLQQGKAVIGECTVDLTGADPGFLLGWGGTSKE